MVVAEGAGYAGQALEDRHGAAVDRAVVEHLVHSRPHHRSSQPCAASAAAAAAGRSYFGLIRTGGNRQGLHQNDDIFTSWCRKGFLPAESSSIFHGS